MDWKAIMEMEDPREALKEIDKKIEMENLSLQEVEDRVEENAYRTACSSRQKDKR